MLLLLLRHRQRQLQLQEVAEWEVAAAVGLHHWQGRLLLLQQQQVPRLLVVLAALRGTVPWSGWHSGVLPWLRGALQQSQRRLLLPCNHRQRLQVMVPTLQVRALRLGMVVQQKQGQ